MKKKMELRILYLKRQQYINVSENKMKENIIKTNILDDKDVYWGAHVSQT